MAIHRRRGARARSVFVAPTWLCEQFSDVVRVERKRRPEATEGQGWWFQGMS